MHDAVDRAGPWSDKADLPEVGCASATPCRSTATASRRPCRPGVEVCDASDISAGGACPPAPHELGLFSYPHTRWHRRERRGLADLGVRTVAIPRKAAPGLARHKNQRAKDFVKLIKWRTGCKARVSFLKRDYGWSRTRIDGLAAPRPGAAGVYSPATPPGSAASSTPTRSPKRHCIGAAAPDPPPAPHDAICRPLKGVRMWLGSTEEGNRSNRQPRVLCVVRRA